MTRARSGKTVLRGRKRMRKLTKGFCMSRHNLYRQSAVTLIRAGVYRFRDRRVRKREVEVVHGVARIRAVGAAKGKDIAEGLLLARSRPAGMHGGGTRGVAKFCDVNPTRPAGAAFMPLPRA